MKKRMTWDEIHSAYPDMWVVLDNVEFMDNDGINVDSAIVIIALRDEDYLAKRLEFELAGKNYFYTRTEDSGPFCGVML